jgi:hypothetical protein
MELSQSQQNLLVWIIETAQGDVVWLRTGNAPEDLLSVVDGTKRRVNPDDMRDMVALGLLRPFQGDRHVITSAGWAASVQIKDATRRDGEPADPDRPHPA